MGTQLKRCWTDTRGKYSVDFSRNPCEISGEANGPQPIVKDDLSLSLKKKSSIYLPNPVNGGTLSSPKEQDALILNLIAEYEKRKRFDKKKRTTTAALNLAPNFDDDMSSEYSEEMSKDEEDESDDPLYRQVSQMDTNEMDQQKCIQTAETETETEIKNEDS